ncbi:DNA helicase [Thiohalocapsa phage LS06-2018-MD03]|nr:DNA helicase [Thiohalocapsa phage LS06-2018-MD03]
MAKPEALLATQMSNHLIENYPKVPFRFDNGADVPLPIQVAKRFKELHGKWSKGYPDLFIATCRGGFGGLYLELKATDEVPNTEHTRIQAMYHAVLRHNGYKVDFCCGLKDCKKKLKKYLKMKLKKGNYGRY